MGNPGEHLASHARAALGLDPKARIDPMRALLASRGVDIVVAGTDEVDRRINGASTSTPLPVVLVARGTNEAWVIRMTLAHELAHLLFHGGTFTLSPVDGAPGRHGRLDARQDPPRPRRAAPSSSRRLSSCAALALAPVAGQQLRAHVLRHRCSTVRPRARDCRSPASLGHRLGSHALPLQAEGPPHRQPRIGFGLRGIGAVALRAPPFHAVVIVEESDQGFLVLDPFLPADQQPLVVPPDDLMRCIAGQAVVVSL